MKWSRCGIAIAIGLGAVGLYVGPAAFAQEPEQAGAPPAEKELDQIVETRSEGNEDAAKVQARIDQVSDQTDELVGQYRTTLKQIDSLDLYNGQMQELIAAQQEEVASLQSQVTRIQSVGRSVTPLMLKMVDALERFVALDVPFLIKERTTRVEGLRKMLSRADVTTPEKFRQVMEAYQIENEYGRTIEAYRASLMIGERETTVDFLRFGRIALVYQSLDEQQTGFWNQETKSWVALDSSYRSAVRQGLRIARKQAAPDLVRLPLPAPADKRGSS